MSDVLTPSQRKDKLFAWRDEMETSGIPGAQLPLKSDLETVAKRQVANGEQLSHLLLTRKQLVLDWADQLLTILDPSQNESAAAPAVDQPSKARAESVPTLPQPSFTPTDAMRRFDFAANQLEVRLVDGGALIAWPRKADAPTVWYRVTSRALYRPVSPERSDPIAFTRDPQCLDTTVTTVAVRHLAVWTYSGADDREAGSVQPELWAEGALVAPPQNVVVREQNGQVTGGWQCQPNIEEVQVFRLPIEQAGDEESYPLEFRICADSDNLTGFVDLNAPPGAAYQYRFAAMAEVSDQGFQASPFVIRHIEVVGTLVAVTDLRIDERGDGIYLSWTPPALGHSLLFQTDKAPAAGADDVLEVSALPRAGLSNDRRLPMPAQLIGGRLTVGPVRDPGGWARTHYSVAVVAGDRAAVGPSVARSHAEAIKSAVILERVDHQLVVFDWPGSAVQVDVFLASPNSSYAPSRDQVPHATMTEQDFRKRGGLVLGDGGTGPALSRPCRVYLVPGTFESGRIVATTPVACEYPGLARIAYALDTQKSGIRSRVGRTTVMVSCEFDSPMALSMALVWRPDRLPLYRDDGTVLAQARAPLTPTMQALLEVERLPTTAGFIRLFVAQPPGSPRLAVLDPPFPQLCVP